ncbi:MAG TPA: FAD-dependent oxidoreductase, partial [Allosphingosinicella sp.]
ALSRRGLLPRAHAESAPPPSAPEGLVPRCTALLRAIRAAARETGWRGAVDSLRPHTQKLWETASEAERSRFLRHLRPWWDVHRHRIAPSIAARLDAMIAAGRLSIVAGRIEAVEAQGQRTMVRYRARGSDEVRSIPVRRIVNCTGPQSDIARADNPLIRALYEEGRIRPDTARIGIDVDAECRAFDARGQASPTLFVIGPMTKSRWWEIVAVPDLRVQVRGVAERLGEAP